MRVTSPTSRSLYPPRPEHPVASHQSNLPLARRPAVVAVTDSLDCLFLALDSGVYKMEDKHHVHRDIEQVVNLIAALPEQDQSEQLTHLKSRLEKRRDGAPWFFDIASEILVSKSLVKRSLPQAVPVSAQNFEARLGALIALVDSSEMNPKHIYAEFERLKADISGSALNVDPQIQSTMYDLLASMGPALDRHLQAKQLAANFSNKVSLECKVPASDDAASTAAPQESRVQAVATQLAELGDTVAEVANDMPQLAIEQGQAMVRAILACPPDARPGLFAQYADVVKPLVEAFPAIARLLTFIPTPSAHDDEPS